MVLFQTANNHNHLNIPRKGLSPLSKTPIPTFSSPSSPTPSMAKQTIQNAESIIKKWDVNSSSLTSVTPLFHHNRKEAREFLKCVMDLRGSMHFLVSQNSSPHDLVLAQNLMQIAMKRLEKEFYQILASNRERLDPESVSTSLSSDGSASFHYDDDEDEVDQLKIAGESISEVERVSALAMTDLKAIAECMSSSGYGKECLKIYKLFRKSIVDRGLYLLGIEKFKSSQINKMNWESLDFSIKNWLNAVKIAVKSLFNGEKILCDHVFSASQTIRDACFAEITMEGATNLFKFPEIIAQNKNSRPERIFRLLELHGTISELRPEIESIFNVDLTSAIKSHALSSLQKVGDSVFTLLINFGSSIRKDSSKTPVPGGGIHPLTQSSMSYISSLSDYDRILSDILSVHPPAENPPFPESYFNNPTAIEAAPIHLAWLILVLLCKIDSKAQQYKDVSLSYLFLANNLQFIINQVQTSNLQHLLGDQWLSKHTQKIKQYASSYELVAWNRVFKTLPERTTPELSHEAVKDCFRRFNAAFEEAYMKQILRSVPDGKLRDELKVSIAGKLVPVYKEFYETYSRISNGDFVRISPDDLGNYLSDLFHGTRISSSSLPSPSSSHSNGCLLR
ncbi:Pectin lyase-like superfamily protein isoform 1 [Hibiscus syriacus]|uniref:Exocyst subunit Exo70 family protein n=1 Tax=Hibiscus syriacus TaxID=106335 RepID=A0A6A2W7W9_HIBSY|nr:exocyst complex component EXO70H1 [Hibiscus syriacus]KAE8653683.1 Pectin lyase-like superfamily protein isoform 1 [Hibiscus syriacus]